MDHLINIMRWQNLYSEGWCAVDLVNKIIKKYSEMLERFDMLYDPEILKSFPKIELTNMFRSGSIKLSLEDQMKLKV